MKSIFSGGMHVGENSSQPTSVEFVRIKRANYARGGLYLTQKSGFAALLT